MVGANIVITEFSTFKKCRAESQKRNRRVWYWLTIRGFIITMKLSRPAAGVTLIGFAALAMALVLRVIVFPEDRITQANFDRIKAGMSEQQVNEILGQPT